MKIKDLWIKYFQGHEDTRIKLSPGVNVFTGPSDSGKSSLIRALKWLIKNKPQGDAYISHFRKKGESTAVSSGSVSRERGKQNKYVVDGETYKALRTDVPDQVKHHFNIPDDSIQSQADQYFLLSETPGQAAKRFNKLAGLEQIDEVLRDTSTIIRSTKSDISYGEDMLENLQGALDRTSWADNADYDITVLEQKEARRDKLKRIATDVHFILYSIEDMEETIADTSHIIKAEVECKRLTKLHIDKSNLIEGTDILVRHLKEIEDTQLALNTIIIPDVGPIDHCIGLQTKLKEKKEHVGELLDLLVDIKDTEVYIEREGLKIFDNELKFKEEMGDTCELCGSKLPVLR